MMTKDRENPKTEHKKKLHQNATDEKGAQKKDHYNQYGKQGEDRKRRGAAGKDD
ncbi:hypothetical protein DFQ11_102544 [Winogradskyella epiphytica]|uniref:Uncharacterized protein n=1 Tax=Winogradskyella epiphytica TaxID=262005 RepID=A0A2V4XGH7_9FLAO|nr:hypothetical protein [Winogradskyella epiphytica]PYE81964.1 hypothetical protein DFQ11_102544 [Winogradskyella epiphytica]GGW61454.1 hypothetical protein GCM10008085_11270 [Winogradskyella epiphytica]